MKETWLNQQHSLSSSLGISDPSSVESLYYTSSESGDEDHDTLSGDHHVMLEDSILDDGGFSNPAYICTNSFCSLFYVYRRE